MKQNEIEQIIILIKNGYSLKSLSFELDIPIEQLQIYQKQLELRRFAKESLKNGKIAAAIEKLSSFVDNAPDSLVERMILLKLQAYSNGTTIDEDELAKIEEERKSSGFLHNIDEILEELQVQIPKRKNSNLRKKQKQDIQGAIPEEESIQEENIEDDNIKEARISRYNKLIERYKKEIAKNPQSSSNARNLLAFAHFRLGNIDEARDELISLIEERGSYMAYRQLIYLEKSQGNFGDAKLWGEACLEQFPNSVDVRRQLISVATEEKDNKEIIRQLREIIKAVPDNEKDKRMLEIALNEEEK